MSIRQKLARVTVTIPADVLRTADAQAKRERRSRSWVVSEALRQFADREAPGTVETGRLVREPVLAPYAAQAFESADIERLAADLQLTAEERVRQSETLARVQPDGRRRPQFRQIVQFSTYEDYLDWRDSVGWWP